MLKVNVGLSRKIGEAGYSSRGGAVHLELELDSGLAAEPARLQERLRHLFGLARTALAAELHPPAAVPLSAHGAGTLPASVPAAPAAMAPPAATTRSFSPPTRNGVRQATPAQVQALYALARDKGVSARDFSDHRCNVSRPEDLTLRQASQLIDELKALPAPIMAEEEATEPLVS